MVFRVIKKYVGVKRLRKLRNLHIIDVLDF